MKPLADQTPSRSASVEALREEAIALCQRAGWSPQCIGTERFKIGVYEIYEELRCLQKIRCVDVAEDLIECCRRHQHWSPLFEDVEARIALFRGETERAESIWTDLLNHRSEILRLIADNALRSLEGKRESGEQLVTDVLQALDRNEHSRAHLMLYEALIKAKDLEDTFLLSALEASAMSRVVPSDWPWNQGLFIEQLVLDLFDQQLSAWEDHVT